MNNDRELLELAAKAYFDDAIVEKYVESLNCLYVAHITSGTLFAPLTDDGHALRLAVKLGINLMHSKHKVKAGRKLIEDGPCEEDKRPDPYAATRRAIVRAAAEIGKEQK